MSLAYATPLELDIRPSAAVRRYLVLVHGLALLSVMLLPVEVSLRGVAAMLVLVSFMLAWHRHKQSVRLEWRETDWLIRRAERENKAELLASSLLMARLTLLHFKLDNGRRLCLLVLPDALDSGHFRRLRVRLRVSAQTRSSHARMKL